MFRISNMQLPISIKLCMKIGDVKQFLAPFLLLPIVLERGPGLGKHWSAQTFASKSII